MILRYIEVILWFVILPGLALVGVIYGFVAMAFSPPARFYAFDQNPNGLGQVFKIRMDYWDRSVYCFFVRDKFAENRKPLCGLCLDKGFDFDPKGFIWSKDGNMIAVKKDGFFISAYDFTTHGFVYPEFKKIEDNGWALYVSPDGEEKDSYILSQLDSRGGMGRMAEINRLRTIPLLMRDMFKE